MPIRKKGQADFPKHSITTREAISVARRLRDPLVEFSQLYTSKKDILCVCYHHLQDHILRNELFETSTSKFIKRTNQAGFDINLALKDSMTMNLAQFICGMRAQKRQRRNPMKFLTRKLPGKVESRSQLKTVCGMSPEMYINYIGFMKILSLSGSDTPVVGELDERL